MYLKFNSAYGIDVAKQPVAKVASLGLAATLDFLSFTNPTLFAINMAIKVAGAVVQLLSSSGKTVDAALIGVDAFALYSCVNAFSLAVSPGFTYLLLSIGTSLIGSMNDAETVSFRASF